MEKLSEEDINKLYTYCALNENGKNIVAKIKSCEIKAWEEKYKKCFNESYFSLSSVKSTVRTRYCDPDTTYKKGCNHHFFEQLTQFLNKREEEFWNSPDSKLEKKYKYCFKERSRKKDCEKCKPRRRCEDCEEGIEVFENNCECNKKRIFFLRSDQFGFSAPTKGRDYPYDLYLMKSENKDDALKQVVDWIAFSRTIGGSFLWPTPFYQSYNLSRGGKISSPKEYYIQDRVDLTLWEIYYWYNKKEKSTKMTTVRNKKAADALEKWLSHFKNFKTYIDFFCFEDFVNEKGYPINILNGGAEEPQWNNNIIGRNPEITELLELEKIKAMLERLNNQILNRSKKMEQIISSECNENSKTK